MNIPQNTIVYADTNMLMMVIRNLVSNAIKFTHADGEVQITSKTLGTYEEITVSDTGLGMSQEDTEKLFKIDIIHSTPGTADERGTGLGLILCKESVEKHGGQIWVNSEVGKGSSFRFTLLRTNSI